MPKKSLSLHGLLDIGLSNPSTGRPVSHLIDCRVSARFEITGAGIARLAALPWVEYAARSGRGDMKLQLIVRVADLPPRLQTAHAWPLIEEQVLAVILNRR